MKYYLNYLTSLFNKVFSMEQLDQLAVESDFKKRKRKLTPSMFVEMCVSDGDDLCSSSL